MKYFKKILKYIYARYLLIFNPKRVFRVINPLANIDETKLQTRPFGIVYSTDPKKSLVSTNILTNYKNLKDKNLAIKYTENKKIKELEEKVKKLKEEISWLEEWLDDCREQTEMDQIN
jgi:hypothetical protein